MKIEKIEDIYPLTIVSMRYNGFAIIEAYCDAVCVNSLEGNEDWSYDPHYFMKKEWEHINYGIGKTIQEAFEDFKIRYNEIIK